MTCSTCAFWNRKDEANGVCVRFPPSSHLMMVETPPQVTAFTPNAKPTMTPRGVSLWPVTKPDERCGEWRLP